LTSATDMSLRGSCYCCGHPLHLQSIYICRIIITTLYLLSTPHTQYWITFNGKTCSEAKME